MRQTQLPEYGISGTYDQDKLMRIYEEFSNSYGALSKLTLTAQYNVAWADLENKRYQEARQKLEQLKPLSEKVFGELNLQYIMCAATLARANLRCHNFKIAQGLIEDLVVKNIRRMFTKSHPYYFEARHRQGSFLIQLSDCEEDLAKQQTTRFEAEGILREVVLWRCTVLGNNNPRTKFTFHTLRDLLKKQGKMQEAATLHEWVLSSCQQARLDLFGHKFELIRS
jgi:hypothetical protein